MFALFGRLHHGCGVEYNTSMRLEPSSEWGTQDSAIKVQESTAAWQTLGEGPLPRYSSILADPSDHSDEEREKHKAEDIQQYV